jgi:DNA-directed RNA polymerase subunit RPC12/RpoP
MDINRAFKILEIDKDASPREIKQAYRAMASIFHPDHHAQNPRLQKKAQERMKEINTAYDCIVHFLLKDKADIYTDQSANDYYEQSIVTCPNCGAKNRIRSYTQDIIIKCGKCGFTIFAKQDTAEEDDWEKRNLCGDGECIGVIGPDGRCNVCGKSFEEARKADEYRTKLKEKEFQQWHERLKKREKAFYTATTIGLSIFVFIVFAGYIIDNPPIRKSGQLNFPRKVTSSSTPVIKTTKRPTSSQNELTENLIKGNSSYESYFTKDFFKKSALSQKNVLILQNNLLAIGYQVGPVDGILGNKTLAAIRQFSNDFRIKPNDNFANDILASTNYHATIASGYPDWRNIVKSGELSRWVNRQIPDFKRQIRGVLKTGQPRQIITLLNYYKFDKEKPPPLPLPKNGIIISNFEKGVAPLKIVTRHINQHHYIKLVNLVDKKKILTAFVRGGENLEIEVPLGSYELRYAVGKTWFGLNFLFGPNTFYHKADSIFEFERRGYEVSGYTIELFLQKHGNLRTQEISVFSF